jgi:hypothetical protein
MVGSPQQNARVLVRRNHHDARHRLHAREQPVAGRRGDVPLHILGGAGGEEGTGKCAEGREEGATAHG